jgi:hypothetical protein
MSKHHQLLKLINKHLPEVSSPLPQEIPEVDIFEAVRIRVKFLLDNNMERLLHMLYRVDVDESRVREILAMADPGVIDVALTEAILARIREKIRTRERYGKGD